MLRKSTSRQTPPPVAKQASSPALPVRRPLPYPKHSSIRESWSFMKDKLNNSYSAMRKTRALSVGSRSQTANGKKFHSVDHGSDQIKSLKHQSVDSGLWTPVWTQGAQSYGVFHGYKMECVKSDPESSN